MQRYKRKLLWLLKNKERGECWSDQINCRAATGLWVAGKADCDIRRISKRYMNILQSIQRLDGEILLQIQQHLRSDMLTPFMKSVTFLGNGGWFWILCAVVLLVIPKTRKTGCAAALSLILGAIVTNLLLKNIVARPRPFAEIEALIPLITKPKDFSFPSGHTTASFAVALVMLRMLPKKFGIPAVVLAALVAFSRLYLGVHYPTDVLTGFVIALVGSTLSVWIVRTKPEDKQVH